MLLVLQQIISRYYSTSKCACRCGAGNASAVQSAQLEDLHDSQLSKGVNEKS